MILIDMKMMFVQDRRFNDTISELESRLEEYMQQCADLEENREQLEIDMHSSKERFGTEVNDAMEKYEKAGAERKKLHTDLVS